MRATVPSPRRGFTLIELLVVIAIVAVLAVTVILTLNPAELLKQTRDGNRLAELNSLNKALSLVETEVANASFGTSTTVYVSIPDSSTTCANLGLPTLPAGYFYGCAPTSTLRTTNGTGWVPVNFGLISSGSPLSVLPVDPVNTTSTGQYYTYIPGGSWELTALMESSKYRERGINDGDAFPGVLSVGSTHGITPGTRDAGLVGYWSFDEGSGTTAYDRSGNGNSGTLTNSPTWATASSCKVGGCMSFDGTNDYVNVGDKDSMEGTAGITIMAWINPSLLGGEKAVVSKYSSSWLLEPVGSTLSFYVPSGSTSGGTVSVGTWFLVAGVYDGSAMRIYRNGIQTGTGARTGSVSSGVSPVQIGSYGSGGNPFSGFIDEVRVYNRALSAAEIQAIYSATQ